MIEKAQPITILLIEDNDGDIFLTKKAFQNAKIVNRIDVAKDGEIALDMLRNNGPYKDSVRPDIILMDLNLPKKDGLQVLAEIKLDESLRRIPVVILTSSQAEQDVIKTYNLHASSYITKPIDLEKFHEIVTALEDFWFSVVVLPKT